MIDLAEVLKVSYSYMTQSQSVSWINILDDGPVFTFFDGGLKLKSFPPPYAVDFWSPLSHGAILSIFLFD